MFVEPPVWEEDNINDSHAYTKYRIFYRLSQSVAGVINTYTDQRLCQSLIE